MLSNSNINLLLIVSYFLKQIFGNPNTMDLYEFLVDSELQHYYNSIKYV